MILWESKWEQDRSTLLHEIIKKPKPGNEPPISLLQMVLDIAPSVLTLPNHSGWLPLSHAVCLFSFEKPYRGRTLETIKFLVEADTTKESLTSEIMRFSVWRGDVDISKYLLSHKEGRSALVLSSSHTMPVYYASRDYFNDNGEKEEKEEISDEFLRTIIEATAEKLKIEDQKNDVNVLPPRCCCLYGAIKICAEDSCLHDEKHLKNMVKRDHLYCSRHIREMESDEECKEGKKRKRNQNVT